MMKGDTSHLKSELKSLRSKALGKKDGQRKPLAPKKESPVTNSDEVSGEQLARDAQRRQHKEQLLEREAKRKSKEDAYVKSKLEAERNRRLRQGSPMTREERAAFESKLRLEAESRYMPKSSTLKVKKSPVQQQSSVREYVNDSESMKLEEARLRRENEAEQQRLKEQLEEEELARARAAALEMEKASERQREEERQRQMEQMYESDHDSEGSEHYVDEDDEEPFRPEENAQWNSSNQWQPRQQIENNNETPPPQTFGANSIPVVEQQNRFDQIESQNTASEAEWQAELESRKVDVEESKATRRELLPQFENIAEINGRELKLRTFKVVKNSPTEALGVQFYTPTDGVGVRITALHMRGPFGRCGAFQDDDVLVEINGKRVLNSDHPGVIASIKAALADSMEMMVTVCRPEDLVSDEATTPSSKTSQPSAWNRFLRTVKKPFVSDSKQQPVVMKDASPIRKAQLQGVRNNLVGIPLSPPKQTENISAPQTPPAYLIYRADVRDLESYKHNYMSKTSALISKFGGEWLARGGKITTLEGPDETENVVLQRMVLIKFPTMEAAKRFFHSEEYQEARAQRLSIATAELTVLEGMPLSF